MRIGVQLGVNPGAAEAISARLSMKWDPSEVVVFREAPPEGEFDGLLLIRQGWGAPLINPPLMDVVEISAGTEDLDDVIYQADAKLGRLTKSYLVRRSTRSFLTREAEVSRRELLMGARKGFRRYSKQPFVFNDSCEAKRGCTKCLDACPAKALHLSDGQVTVGEAECTVCGACAAVCPVGAVQMPELSDDALAGLLDEVDESAASRKTLVLTCSAEEVDRKPWMVVEQVSSVGMFGTRQIAACAASSLGGIAVVCPDGSCVGAHSAKKAVTAICGSVAGGPDPPFVVFLGGKEEMAKLSELHAASQARTRRAPRSGERWKDYVADLTSLVSAGSPASGLGLTGMTIDGSCTLCSACAKACPHGSLRVDDRHLFLSAATCTGCGLCVNTCPEHSIVLTGATGAMSQVMETRIAHEDELVTCEKCGAPLGSAKFVNKVTAVLGPDAKHVRYCPDCKKKSVIEALFGG